MCWLLSDNRVHNKTGNQYLAVILCRKIPTDTFTWKRRGIGSMWAISIKMARRIGRAAVGYRNDARQTQTLNWNSLAAGEEENRTTDCLYMSRDYRFTLLCTQFQPSFTFEHSQTLFYQSGQKHRWSLTVSEMQQAYPFIFHTMSWKELNVRVNEVGVEGGHVKEKLIK